MKYRNLDTATDWNDHAHLEPAPQMNVVALRRPPVGHSSDHTCASRDSWLDQLAADFGVAGEALAVSGTIEAGTPAAAPSGPKRVSPRHMGWLARFGAAIAGRYRGCLRETAIRQGVQELRRLDSRTLRDIGIFDPSAIECFVRNGRDC